MEAIIDKGALLTTDKNDEVFDTSSSSIASFYM